MTPSHEAVGSRSSRGADYSVVIAGGGPVGLMLACELGLAGVDVLVIERLTSIDPTMKAGYVNLATAQAFYRRGMLPQLQERHDAAVERMQKFLATKGIENGTYKRMTEVAADAAGTQKVAALSGPTFAKEVARGDPTALTVASVDPNIPTSIQREFSDPMFRVYTSDDVPGVELGGSLKNVIAIAAGIVEGLGFGHNTAAALITRGLAEITRLAVACGARRETLSGLAGMGDLVLTCTGGLSRNRTVGVELGRGRKLRDIMAGMHGMVAEGVLTADAALGLAALHAVEMPITEQMHAILHEEKSPNDAIRDLMNRPGKEE